MGVFGGASQDSAPRLDPGGLATPAGTVEIRRPRVRGLEERFESRIFPLFKRRTEGVAKMIPELYLHGLSQGDFELALRGLLGDSAPLSATSVRRLTAKWKLEFEEWTNRSLVDKELVYLYVKPGLEKDKAVLLVAIGAMADGTKQVLAVESGFRESEKSWSIRTVVLRQTSPSAGRIFLEVSSFQFLPLARGPGTTKALRGMRFHKTGKNLESPGICFWQPHSRRA